jgi:hypothetical protein
MATFKVTSPIKHDGERYEIGESIELSAKEAAQIPWAVEAPPAPPEKKEKTKE